VTGPVVLIHGVGLDATMWSPVVELLAPQFEMHTFDLIGHGTRRGELPSMDRFVGQTLAKVDGQMAIVGFSLGALIAQEVALRAPDRVTRLAAVSGVFRRTPAERAAVLARVESVRNGGYTDSVHAAIDRWFSAEFAARSPRTLAKVRAVLEANRVDSYSAAYEVFATADESLASRVGDITCPALAVTGADDPGSSPAMTRALALAVPDGRACVIDNARHLLPLEQPTMLATVLAQFLAE
jgi:(E)-2-((N-methylformamido)methylene)succinate hydrolase